MLDTQAHAIECLRYGVKPLTDDQRARMHREGLRGTEAAFSIASDLAAGWTWREAVEAYRLQAD